MSVTHSEPAIEIREYSEEELATWVAEHREGRLGCQTGRGWRSIPVRYVAADGAILVELPTYHDLVQHAPGQPVTFEIPGRTRGGELRTVTVHGMAYVADRRAVSARVGFEPQWPEGLPVRVIGVPFEPAGHQTPALNR